MHILIVHGSRRGGTAGLAAMAADEFEARDCGVTVVEPMDHPVVGGADAVVVGGPLYAGRWPRDLAAFVRRHATELRDRPTYFFSSGPLDDSATDHEIAPTKQVRRLMDKCGTSNHITFGGRLTPDADGFMARSMARDHAGDWRDVDQVRRWVDRVVDELEMPDDHLVASESRRERRDEPGPDPGRTG